MQEQAKAFNNLIQNADNIIIIQAENPDADSIASSLALEDFLFNLGKKTSLHCPVNIPNYLRYLDGWDRITPDFDYQADLAIIVDTTSKTLLSRSLEIPAVNHFLLTKPTIFIDHHLTAADLDFEPTLLINNQAVATSEVIFDLANELNWSLNPINCEFMLSAILGDTLGLSTDNVASRTFEIVAELVKHDCSIYQVDKKRLELSKKEPEILKYKGELLQRVEFELDNKLALVHVPFEEIKTYSDKYNPAMLVIEEMKFVQGTDVAIVIKTYPDGKLTGKIRSNTPVAETIAGYFGGGGHKFAAGFRVYGETYQSILPEIIKITSETLNEKS